MTFFILAPVPPHPPTSLPLPSFLAPPSFPYPPLCRRGRRRPHPPSPSRCLPPALEGGSPPPSSPPGPRALGGGHPWGSLRAAPSAPPPHSGWLGSPPPPPQPQPSP